MTTKALKTINGTIWGAFAFALNIGVWRVWSSQGSDEKSLILGSCFFTALCVGFWYIIHNHINEVNQ